MDLCLIWYNLFLKHPRSTSNPQGYWTHANFSIINSIKGTWYMIIRIIHGIFPSIFMFSTSSWIIKSFVALVASERHHDEMWKYVDDKTLHNLDLQAKYKFFPSVKKSDES